MPQKPHISHARRAFIEKHKDLFWFTPADKKFEVSDELLITQIINEAELPVIFEMIELLGEESVRTSLNNFTGRKAGNIYPEYLNYFKALLNSDAHRHS